MSISTLVQSISTAKFLLSIAKLKDFTLVDLKIFKTEFSGKIPDGLWRAENLASFMISDNKFNGELPQNLSSCISLFDILSYNQFYGGIPIGVASWINVVKFIASKNYLNGSVPPELTALPKLQTLLLDQNQLKGSLPNDILSWKSLVILNQLIAFDSSFLNNSGLCADKPKLSVSLCNFGLEKPTKTSHWSIGLIISLTVVTFLLALLASFMIIKLYKKRKHESESSWKLISFQRLSFTELDILSSMTEQNITGSGGFGTVYCVRVNGLSYVAVKKIMSNR
ncbi:unnamed protein product [Vicia faba]|uniref:Uncharacterized protein n=1 Tax=Vicia faba TaxID=3906 RepID=A0AAV0Z6R7_VICFA|nr:unnamed protein product [Vicia faba]